jgi:hypothetical protein
MSSIKLPHASGNSMSIAAPATNPASNLELKLPATIGTAGQLLRNSSTPGTLEFGTAGKILQVVGNLNTGGGTSTSSSSWTETYITDTITPIALGSKIFVALSGMGGYLASSTQGFANATLGRNVNSEGWSYLGDSTNGMAYVYSQAGASGWWDANVSYLDSPTYTAGEAIVYSLFIKCNTNVTTFAIGNGNSHSPIVLMEVAA